MASAIAIGHHDPMDGGANEGAGGRRILVVDGDRRSLEDLCAAVEAAGHRAEGVLDAQEAMNVLAAGGVDAVVVDTENRRAGGHALIRQLGRDGNEVPLVGVGSKPDAVELIRLYRRGVVDFVIRPVRRDEVEDVLERVVSQLERIEALVEAAQAPKPTAARPEGVRDPIAVLIEELQAGKVEIPALSPLGQRVQELMSMPTCGVREVLEVIEADPAVLSRVLRVANSAVYAGQGNATTPKQACMRLGNHESLSVARDTILGAMFHLDGTPLEQVALSAWRNVLVTARTARDLADLLCIGEPETLHTAALLHNVGELIFLRLASQLPPDPEGPEATIRKLAQPIEQLHEAIGAKVLSTWGVPDELVRIASCHHDLSKCVDEEHELQAAVVQLAWAAATKAGYGFADVDGVDLDALLELVGASQAELDGILAKAPEWLEHAGA